MQELIFATKDHQSFIWPWNYQTSLLVITISTALLILWIIILKIFTKQNPKKKLFKSKHNKNSILPYEMESEVDASQESLSFYSTVRSISEFKPGGPRDENRALYNELIGNFYTDIYEERFEGVALFKHWLDTFQKPLLLLTGHIGVGKSTYIYHKYDFENLCTGIIVDFEVHGHEIQRQVSPKEKTNEFLEVIRRVIRNFLIDYKAIQIYDDKLLPSPAPHNYKLRNYCPNNKWQAKIPKATLELAAHILTMGAQFRDTPEIDKAIKEHGHIQIGHTIKDIHNHYKKGLSKRGGDLGQCYEIINSLRIPHLFALYRDVIKPEIPIVLTLDNTDSIGLQSIESGLFPEVQELERRLNGGENAHSEPVRIIFGIRDQHASLVSQKFVDHTLIMHLAMGPYDKNIPELEKHDVPAYPKFASSVVRKRLNFLKNSAHINADEKKFSYFQDALGFWFEKSVENSEMSAERSGFHVFNLTNTSIRLMLEHLANFGLSVVKYMEDFNIDPDCLAKPGASVWLRGRVIKTIWGPKIYPILLDSLKRGIEEEVDDKKTQLSLFRMLLTYLVNVAPSEGNKWLSLEELKNAMSLFMPNYSIDQIKELLWAMYSGQHSHCELILIAQDTIVDGPADIQDLKPIAIDNNAKIRAMPRAEELLRSLLISIDYYGSMLLHQPGDKDNKEFIDKALMEMLPEEAYKYIKRIYCERIKKMKTEYKKAWRLIRSSLRSESRHLGSNQECFNVFDKNGMVYKNDFYITRVCNSHQNDIKNYLWQVLLGDNTRLFLSREGKKKVASMVEDIKQHHWTQKQELKIKDYYEKCPNDDEMEFFINCIPDEHLLKKIWLIHDKYLDIIREYSQLKN